ncbi:C40 family peptidase [Paenibacillus oenotherae]|nr:C40 family peptidase [Paenibacillus oenotherae]
MRIQYLRSSRKAIGITVIVSAIMFSLLPQPASAQNVAALSSSNVNEIIAIGTGYMGTPYEFGSNRNTTRTFDCSDFIHYIFKKGVGITLPSTSATQARYIKEHSEERSSWRNLKRGDLMFFMDYHGLDKADYTKYPKSRQSVTHVAIYLGNGRMLHTFSKESGGVRIDTIANKHWEYRFLFGGTVQL